MNDKVKDAKWLAESQRDDVEEQLSLEQQGIKPVKNYAEAFKSKVVILLCLQYALWSIGVYGFVMWLPSIINEAPNMDIVTTGWLSSVPYILAIMHDVSLPFFR